MGASGDNKREDTAADTPVERVTGEKDVHPEEERGTSEAVEPSTGKDMGTEEGG